MCISHSFFVRPPELLVKACHVVKQRHATNLNIHRCNNYWLVQVGNGGLIFSDQFLDTCKYNLNHFVEVLEREVIFRGIALQQTIQEKRAS